MSAAPCALPGSSRTPSPVSTPCRTSSNSNDGRRPPMKIVRFEAAGKTRYGVLDGTHILEYSGTPYGTFRKARKRYQATQAVLLAPVVPSKIVAVGLNYRDHAEEMSLPTPDEPVIVLKPLSALCGPGDPIIYPPQSSHVDYEGELAIVIRKRCRHVPPERAREYVLGYTCLNDVTARDLQRRDGMPSRAKAFDTFCPIGPCIATDIDPNAVAAWFSVDVELALDLAPAAVSDDLAAAVDYGAVARRIVEIGTRQRVNLIERLAGLIAEALLKEFPAPEV